jgi:replicative DNA helicase
MALVIIQYAKVKAVKMFDFELEKKVLGGILNNNDKYNEVYVVIGKDDFTHTLHRDIFKTIADFIDKGNPVNIQTLCQLDKYKSHRTEIISLTTEASSTNVLYFANRLRDVSSKRILLKLAEDLQTKIKAPDCDIKNIVDNAENILSKIAVNKQNKDIITLTEAMKLAIKKIEEDYKKSGIPGLRTGFPELDMWLGGLIDQEFIILGARPSIGKSSMATNIAESMVKRNIRVGYFTIEMDAVAITTRILCTESDVSQTFIRAGRLTEHHFDKITATISDLYGKPLYFYDFENAELLDLKNKARQLKRKHNIQVLFIDHIGKIQVPGNMQRWEKFTIISSELKTLARELNIPVVALSQLTRTAENKEPMLSDLRDSGSLEQDADVVMFLHRENRQSTDTELIVAKNRNGRVGSLEFTFIPELTNFIYKGIKQYE